MEKLTIFSQSILNGSVRRFSFLSLYPVVYAGVEPELDSIWFSPQLVSRCDVSSFHARVLCWAHSSFAVLQADSSTSPYHISEPGNILTGACFLSALGVWNQLWHWDLYRHLSTFQIRQVSITQLEVCMQLGVSSTLQDLEFGTLQHWKASRWLQRVTHLVTSGPGLSNARAGLSGFCLFLATEGGSFQWLC